MRPWSLFVDRRGAMRRLRWVFAVGLLACGCAGRPEDPSVLAEVGEVLIRTADLRSFQEHLPPSYRRSKDEKEARGADLQTLIDRQLMEAEAASRGLDGDPQVLEKLREAEDEKLVDLMIDRQIRSRVSVSEEDLAREYEEKGWREQVETLEFFVPTREKADEVVELLNGGADFRDVAGTHSVDRALRVLAAPRTCRSQFICGILVRTLFFDVYCVRLLSGSHHSVSVGRNT